MGEINDGYGAPSEVEVYLQEEVLLAAHYNTAKSLAHQMRIPTDSIDFDDLVQEGAVAAWQATQEERRDPVTYGMVAAKRRIQGHLRGKHPMYGSEKEDGRIYDQFRQVEKREVEDTLVERAWDRDVFSEVERRVDVERALGTLSETDLAIVRGVRLGYTTAEIGESLEMSSNAVGKRWRNYLRPALADRLRVVRAA